MDIGFIELLQCQEQVDSCCNVFFPVPRSTGKDRLVDEEIQHRELNGWNDYVAPFGPLSTLICLTSVGIRLRFLYILFLRGAME